MKNCNGNGQCNPDTGHCLCNVGYTGADCSAGQIDLKDKMS